MGELSPWGQIYKAILEQYNKVCSGQAIIKMNTLLRCSPVPSALKTVTWFDHQWLPLIMWQQVERVSPIVVLLEARHLLSSSCEKGRDGHWAGVFNFYEHAWPTDGKQYINTKWHCIFVKHFSDHALDLKRLCI